MDADEQRGGGRAGHGTTAADMYEMGMSGGVGPAMGSVCAVAASGAAVVMPEAEAAVA